MGAEKEDVIRAIREVEDEVERLVPPVPESAWSRPAYEQGWNAKQLLCHVAATSGLAGFLLAMARNPGATFAGDLDEDAFNAQQVALREGKAIQEIAAEARGHLERDAESVSAAADELLATHFRAPWGTEGRLADVIIDSIEEHLMTHVGDLSKAVS